MPSDEIYQRRSIVELIAAGRVKYWNKLMFINTPQSPPFAGLNISGRPVWVVPGQCLE
jgi:hypothetical protein